MGIEGNVTDCGERRSVCGGAAGERHGWFARYGHRISLTSLQRHFLPCHLTINLLLLTNGL